MGALARQVIAALLRLGRSGGRSGDRVAGHEAAGRRLLADVARGSGQSGAERLIEGRSVMPVDVAFWESM
jgi:hypothetical protein